MKGERRAVLDACVLIPMPLADTLLRMAESPSLFSPKWSQSVMDEVSRNFIQKWGMPAGKAQRRESCRTTPEIVMSLLLRLTPNLT